MITTGTVDLRRVARGRLGARTANPCRRIVTVRASDPDDEAPPTSFNALAATIKCVLRSKELNDQHQCALRAGLGLRHRGWVALLTRTAWPAMRVIKTNSRPPWPPHKAHPGTHAGASRAKWRRTSRNWVTRA